MTLYGADHDELKEDDISEAIDRELAIPLGGVVVEVEATGYRKLISKSAIRSHLHHLDIVV
jgi:hypothetical protein